MLHLQRNLNDDGIVIVAPNGQEIRFHIKSISNTTAKLAFEHSEGFQIWRSEVWERIKSEKQKEIKKCGK